MGGMSGRPRVLVVEDDADIAGVLRRSLDKEGYDVRVAGDGEAALEQSGVFEPDAVVLDLGLPKLDGIEVCRRLRDEGDVPILMLTARDALDARVEGLDSGADDYLVKPFEREELLARHARAAAPAPAARQRLPRGRRPAPQPRHAARSTAASAQLELTAREFELLEHLMRNERIVVSRQALLDEVWGYHPFAETNTVDVFISNLRRKLECVAHHRVLRCSKPKSARPAASAPSGRPRNRKRRCTPIRRNARGWRARTATGLNMGECQLGLNLRECQHIAVHLRSHILLHDQGETDAESPS